MKEIKTIQDLYSAGLLNGMYPGLLMWYTKKFYPNNIPWGSVYSDRSFKKEPVDILKEIDFKHLMNFGYGTNGKKDTQMRMIFENLGYEY